MDKVLLDPLAATPPLTDIQFFFKKNIQDKFGLIMMDNKPRKYIPIYSRLYILVTIHHGLAIVEGRTKKKVKPEQFRMMRPFVQYSRLEEKLDTELSQVSLDSIQEETV